MSFEVVIHRINRGSQRFEGSMVETDREVYVFNPGLLIRDGEFKAVGKVEHLEKLAIIVGDKVCTYFDRISCVGHISGNSLLGGAAVIVGVRKQRVHSQISVKITIFKNYFLYYKTLLGYSNVRRTHNFWKNRPPNLRAHLAQMGVFPPPFFKICIHINISIRDKEEIL